MVYLEPLLFALVQEGVLAHTDMTASVYARNLIFEDLKSRGLITPEISDALITGKPLSAA